MFKTERKAEAALLLKEMTASLPSGSPQVKATRDFRFFVQAFE
jgi:hypothetical protein